MAIDWMPEQGLRKTTPERLAEMRVEWAEADRSAFIDKGRVALHHDRF
jgi:hypothetical protein